MCVNSRVRFPYQRQQFSAKLPSRCLPSHTPCPLPRRHASLWPPSIASPARPSTPSANVHDLEVVAGADALVLQGVLLTGLESYARVSTNSSRSTAIGKSIDGQQWIGRLSRTTYLGLLNRALLQDRLDHVLGLVRAELILQRRVRGRVALALRALPVALSPSAHVAPACQGVGYGMGWAHLSVTKTLNAFTTSISGTVLSTFHFFTMAGSSTKTMKSFSLPL